MSESKSNVPKLRFPGFTDPWEQRKLGDVASEFQSGEFIPASDISESGAYPVYGGNGLRGYTNRYNHDGFYALIGRQGALCGNVNSSDGKAYFTEHAVAVQANNNNDTAFLVYLLGRMNLGQYSGQSAQPGLAVGTLKAIKASLPIAAEQHLIGAFFRDVDSLIALRQRELDHVKEMKRGLLQKMFPKDGADSPEIRFPGFTDPWEQRKLGEVAKRVTRKNGANGCDLPLTISAQHGLVDQRSFFNKQVASKDMSGYYLLRKGEFAYNKSTSAGSPWGTVKRLTRYEKGSVSTLYICFKPIDADPDWLGTYYETNRWHCEVGSIATEGARNHGLLNVSPDDFFRTRLSIPSAKAEQRLIGAFFRDIDSLIALRQRELDHIKLLKKALLQQMFV